MLWVCVACVIILICGVVFFYAKISAILDNIDEMIDRAIEGTLTENDFSEKKASKIEAKLYRFLRAGKIDRQQAVKERDSIKSLISDISHQTKTPVANILLYTQLLDERGVLGEEEKKLLSSISSQTEKLDFLIQALVKLSRLENGIIAVMPKRDSVEELVGEIDFGAAITKGISFSVEHAPELTALFDRKWTAEALGNLVDNAVKYTPPGGRIRVSAKAYEMFVCIEVADDGMGIKEEETAKIFQRFYRSQQAADEKGVGIGLYLTREIIREQGGYVKVASRPGVGSVFSVFLPR
ncbi:MAG: HAMP domain-containing histidine kinase [Lachnospiraceae bacterium]|nr:HAMP domain-containing histidine kinase [Lachnospiraceae bacterium]